VNEITYSEIVQHILPGAQFVISGDDYLTLVFVDGTPKPTKKTLDDSRPNVEYERATSEVRNARHAAYAAPDGPDAIFLQWQRGDATEQDWLDAVQAVKDSHPYPQEP
jgi:hypothetical protein